MIRDMIIQNKIFKEVFSINKKFKVNKKVYNLFEETFPSEKRCSRKEIIVVTPSGTMPVEASFNESEAVAI